MLLWKTRRFSTYARGLLKELQVREETFAGEAKFLNFCDNMAKLQSQLQVREGKRIHREQLMRTAVLTSKEPTRDIIENYLTSRKFNDCDHLAITLSWLSKFYEIKNPQGFLDITNEELKQSWQFDELLKDLSDLIESRTYMSPPNMAEFAESLSRLGVKDHKMWRMLLDKVHRMLSNPSVENRIDGELGGFQESETFQNYLATLLDWKIPVQKLHTDPILIQLNELEWIVKANKNFQMRFVSALTNLRAYYYNILEHVNEKDILTNNPEIRLMVVELQELLVQAGLVDPLEFTSIKNFETMEARMKGAENIFTTLANEVFPGLRSDSIDAYADVITRLDNLNIPLAGQKKLPTKQFGLEFLGRVMAALADIIHNPVKSVNGPDYISPAIEAYAEKLPGYGLREMNGHVMVNPELTSFWAYGYGVATEFKSYAENFIEDASLEGLCQGAFGFAEMRVVDPLFYKKISDAVLKATGSADSDTLGRGLYGLKVGGVTGPAIEKLCTLLGQSSDLDQIRFADLLRAVIALAAEGKYNSDFLTIVTELNRRSPVHIPRAAASLAGEAAYALSVDAPDHIPILSPSISPHISESYHILAPTSLDPIKPVVAKAVKAYLYKGLSEAEIAEFDSQTKTYNQLFNWDGIVFLNGHKVPIFILGEDGFCGDTLLGHYRMRFKFMEADGFKPLALPLHRLVDIDWHTPKFELRDFGFIDELVKQEIGAPLDVLKPIEGVLAEMMDDLKEVKSERPLSGRYVDMTYDLLGLIKLQTLINVKPDFHTWEAGIDNLKVRLLKSTQRFTKLQPSLQSYINHLTAKHNQGADFTSSLKAISLSLPNTSNLMKLEPWQGVRQLVELPAKGDKDLTPELLNQKFLWLTDYFHYNDWQQKMKAALPFNHELNMQENSAYNFSFFTKRRTMTGLPAQDIKVNGVGRELTMEERCIVSLTNLKYRLKTENKDQVLISQILNRLFLSDLAAEHIAPSSNSAQPPQITRDPDAFVKFMDSQYTVTADIDKFTQFYRKKHTTSELKRKLTDTLEDIMSSVDRNEELGAVEKKLLKNSLLEQYMMTVRPLDASNIERDLFMAQLRSQFQITTDASTLQSSIGSIKQESDYKSSANNAEYLDLIRRKAESKLIKACILRKLHSGRSLNAAQMKYFKKWIKELRSANLYDQVMLPEHCSKALISNLPADDRIWLTNLVGGVLIESEYGVNELVFELSHFIDEEPIRRFEETVIEDRLLPEFNIDNVTGISRLNPSARNKEIWLTTAEMEEYYWRRTGQFSAEDLKHFWEFYSISRNHTPNQQRQLKLDWDNFTNFLAKANKFDFRMPLVKQCNS